MMTKAGVLTVGIVGAFVGSLLSQTLQTEHSFSLLELEPLQRLFRHHHVSPFNKNATEQINSDPHDHYSISIFSTDPLVIYIENFVSVKEASKYIALAEENFRPSEVWSDDGNTGVVEPSVRDSQWASPSSTEPIVQAIRRRVKKFQGFSNAGHVEAVKVLKYEVGGHYNHHHDAFPRDTARRTMEGNRLSTFFVYLEANCTGGGTNFPRLKVPDDEKWCKFIDCDEAYDAGVTFRPIAGNAIYWHNLKADGQTPHPDLLHAGQPVTSGKKIGLNIWTWTPIDD